MIRKANLAKEANQLVELLANVFQYPEHPEWSADESTIQVIQQRARAYQRMAPILTLFPSYKDRIQGLVYDVEGESVALSLFYETSPKVWYIDYIGVLAEYRQQGVGKALVAATLARIRDFAGTYVSLEVSKGNLPAENLYKRFGFHCITQRFSFEMQFGQTLPNSGLDNSFEMKITTKRDWQTQYMLAKAVVPSAIKAQYPVTLDSYKPSHLAFLSKALNRLAGRRFKFISLHKQGELVGWSFLNMSRNGSGVNAIEIMAIDNNIIADYLLNQTLRIITRTNSAPITLMLDSWQIALKEAASSLFTLKSVDSKLGLTL